MASAAQQQQHASYQAVRFVDDRVVLLSRPTDEQPHLCTPCRPTLCRYGVAAGDVELTLNSELMEERRVELLLSIILFK